MGDLNACIGPNEYTIMNNLNMYNLQSLSSALNKEMELKNIMINDDGKPFYNIIMKYNFSILNGNHYNDSFLYWLGRKCH